MNLTLTVSVLPGLTDVVTMSPWKFLNILWLSGDFVAAHSLEITAFTSPEAKEIELKQWETFPGVYHLCDTSAWNSPVR